MRRLNKILIVLGLFIVVFTGYVIIVNRNSKNMTVRQKILKAVYPALMWWTKIRGSKSGKLENDKVVPPVSFYSLKDTLISGGTIAFDSLRGKKVLIVNTASDCGYTDQYDDLQKLSERYSNNLVILGYPANDFKEQEKGTNEEIAEFCRINYGVKFPLMKKSVVIRSDEQTPVFRWLTDSSQNGWNKKLPSWNFSKYLINEQGVLTNYFGPSVSPLSSEVTEAIDKK